MFCVRVCQTKTEAANAASHVPLHQTPQRLFSVLSVFCCVVVVCEGARRDEKNREESTHARSVSRLLGSRVLCVSYLSRLMFKSRDILAI